MTEEAADMPEPIETGDVRPSVAALLSNIVDYAGLFPPAKLDMETTVQNYARFLDGPHAWLLERLVVPAARLEEFEREAAALLPTGDDDEPWQLVGLTRPAGDSELERDLEAIERFNATHRDRAHGLALIDVIEMKAGSAGEIDRALDEVPDELFPFFEISVDIDPRGMIAALVGGDAGAKIRMGGETPEMHPAPEHVARFLAGCAAADVPVKMTAGLHDPLRHHAEAVGAKQYGFLNVFIAAALAINQEVPEDELMRVLTAETMDDFEFEHDALRIGTRRLSADELDDARLAFSVSFGSCSFDEPIDGLKSLGLI